MEKEQKYYYGNPISEYGLENGRVDYGTLAKAFDAVLNNDIMNLTYGIGSWEQVSGTIDNTDEIEELEEKRDELEVFQWFIISDWGARLLQNINEIVYYNETLDMYVWGVTHYGTSWDYVLTSIAIDWQILIMTIFNVRYTQNGINVYNYDYWGVIFQW